MYSLIPNVMEMESKLQMFSEICDAHEVVMFERTTFLVICHYTKREQSDAQRFEKISNMIKQFKMSCR